MHIVNVNKIEFWFEAEIFVLRFPEPQNVERPQFVWTPGLTQKLDLLNGFGSKCY